MIVEFNKYEHAILRDIVRDNIEQLKVEQNLLEERMRNLKKMGVKLR